MCSDLVCNVIWSALKDYDESHSHSQIKEQTGLQRGQDKYYPKNNYSIYFNASTRLSSLGPNLSFQDFENI